MKLMALLILLLASQVSAQTLKVAVVDTGADITDPRINAHLCPTGSKDFTGTSLKDVNGHGTEMISLIEQYAKDGDYCLVLYKYYLLSNPGYINQQNEIQALREAVKGNRIINLSGGGPEFNQDEFQIIRDNPSIVFDVAAGNNGQNLDIPGNNFYPASYGLKNVISVENLDSDFNRSSTSNYGNKVTTVEIGENVQAHNIEGDSYITGTSAATAIFTGKLIRKVLDAIQSVRQ